MKNKLPKLTADQCARIAYEESCRNANIMRTAAKKDCEREGLAMNKVIASVEGITLVCDGAEGTLIRIILPDDSEIRIGEAQTQVLYQAFYKALTWLEKGEPPGMS